MIKPRAHILEVASIIDCKSAGSSTERVFGPNIAVISNGPKYKGAIIAILKRSHLSHWFCRLTGAQSTSGNRNNLINLIYISICGSLAIVTHRLTQSHHELLRTWKLKHSKRNQCLDAQKLFGKQTVHANLSDSIQIKDDVVCSQWQSAQYCDRHTADRSINIPGSRRVMATCPKRSQESTIESFGAFISLMSIRC
jgi:hypothetical protein